MRYLNKLLILLAVSLVGCKSPQFTANSKSELAKLCLAEFPFDSTPIETKIDTTYIKVKEFIEVDCDSIGKKKVEHECEVRTITETITVPDSRQSYLILFLEGKLELEQLNTKQLERNHKDELSNKDKAHKEEIKALKSKHKIDNTLIRRQKNIYLLILISIGAVIVVGVLRKLKIIRI